MPGDDNVISLAGRVMGVCPSCGEPVHFADNCIRSHAAVVHVRCALASDGAAPQPDFPRPAPPPDRGA